jgi:hypothetical protein
MDERFVAGIFGSVPNEFIIVTFKYCQYSFLQEKTPFSGEAEGERAPAF